VERLYGLVFRNRSPLTKDPRTATNGLRSEGTPPAPSGKVFEEDFFLDSACFPTLVRPATVSVVLGRLLRYVDSSYPTRFAPTTPTFDLCSRGDGLSGNSLFSPYRQTSASH